MEEKKEGIAVGKTEMESVQVNQGFQIFRESEKEIEIERERKEKNRAKEKRGDHDEGERAR